MKFKGQAKAVAEQIITAFETPEKLPNALSAIFLQTPDTPSAKWSYTNRLLMLLGGTYDARGYKQWADVGRYVRSGTKGIEILAPLVRTDDDGEQCLFGYRAITVHPVENTDGKPLCDSQTQLFLESLPFIEVARSWGINVGVLDAVGALGSFAYSKDGKTQSISLAVENLATWTHELTHAADFRLGTLNTKAGQQLDNEFVAELGGCVLLKILGDDVSADAGGCYGYLMQYADEHNVDLVSTAMKLINRTCAAVALVLEESAAGRHNS